MQHENSLNKNQKNNFIFLKKQSEKVSKDNQIVNNNLKRSSSLNKNSRNKDYSKSVQVKRKFINYIKYIDLLNT